MEFTLFVHEHEYDRNLGTRKLTRVTPYIRLKGVSGAMFLQDGKLWTEDGRHVEMVPKWAADAIAQLTPEARESVGWNKGNQGAVRS